MRTKTLSWAGRDLAPISTARSWVPFKGGSMGVPNNWMIYRGKSQSKVDDLGYPHWWKPPYIVSICFTGTKNLVSTAKKAAYRSEEFHIVSICLVFIAGIYWWCCHDCDGYLIPLIAKLSETSFWHPKHDERYAKKQGFIFEELTWIYRIYWIYLGGVWWFLDILQPDGTAQHGNIPYDKKGAKDGNLTWHWKVYFGHLIVLP